MNARRLIRGLVAALCLLLSFAFCHVTLSSGNYRSSYRDAALLAFVAIVILGLSLARRPSKDRWVPEAALLAAGSYCLVYSLWRYLTSH
ncbi:MAG TPA: hypothetical protein PLL20_00110 [Phycisphaerae bacterium]|nr:hypothetical protein [Phycisphaerae bacterium]HRR84164.1 hypothetical protein [Phycisphaerae bacterium]